MACASKLRASFASLVLAATLVMVGPLALVAQLAPGDAAADEPDRSRPKLEQTTGSLALGRELVALRRATPLRQLTAAAVRGPSGWTAWCAAEPARCARTSPATVPLTAETAATIMRVFDLVHERITPEVEPPGQDVWRVVETPGPGDCEDYALTWREELVRAGLPRGALDIAVAVTEQLEVHAVLVVQTDQGSLVLDNRHDRPVAWSSLPYAWLALEPIHADATAWRTLPDYDMLGAMPTVTAEGRR